MPDAILTDPHHTRQDVRMIRQAIRRKWKIPDAAFDALPTMVVKIAADAGEKTETRLKAVQLLGSMNAQNEDDPKKGLTVNVGVQVDANERRTRIMEQVERLRVGRTIDAVATGPSGAGVDAGNGVASDAAE